MVTKGNVVRRPVVVRVLVSSSLTRHIRGSVGQVVKTSPFHGGITSSILVRSIRWKEIPWVSSGETKNLHGLWTLRTRMSEIVYSQYNFIAIASTAVD